MILFLLLVLFFYLYFIPQLIDIWENPTITHPPYLVSNKIHNFHKTLFIADLHADSLFFNRNLLIRNSYGHIDVPRLIQGNTALQMFTIVTRTPFFPNINNNESYSDGVFFLALLQHWPIKTWWSLKERALYQRQKFIYFIKKSKGKFIFITNRKELNEYIKKRQKYPCTTAALLGLEGGHVLEGKVENVDFFFKQGFRMISLTHFTDNDLGGSAQGCKKGGLTIFGKMVVKRMEGLHVLIDLAHASPKTIDDVLDITTKPLVVSHTGVKGVINNNRNLSDRQIYRIAQKGGIIGIGFWDIATGNTVKDIARSIRYTTNLVGVEHVALGSDYDGFVKAPFDTSGMALMTEALINEGFSEKDIRSIMGSNIIKLLNEILPEK
jgi:microsomal dipeptidase-like Zn-dependent dipeptidase